MTKKKIGESVVIDGNARGCFTLPSGLGKGVYELIGEYKGTSVYRPSYDIKKLIIGWKTDIEGLSEWYKVDDKGRELTVTGRLVGYDDTNVAQPLANQKIGLKIGVAENPLEKSIRELSLDALTLKTITGSTTVTTDSNGTFTFTTSIPEVYDEWEYRLYVNYGGNYDYVSCVKERPLYIGDAPTFVGIHVDPVGYHLHPQGGFKVRAAVFLDRDVDDNGMHIAGAKRIQNGSLIFKESNSGKDGTWTNLADHDGYKMSAQPLSENNGYVYQRVEFNFDEEAVFEKYIYAQYGGSSSNIGYKPMKSRVIHLYIDKYGVKLEHLNESSPCSNSIDTPIWVLYGTGKSCNVAWTDGTAELPTGDIDITLEND